MVSQKTKYPKSFSEKKPERQNAEQLLRNWPDGKYDSEYRETRAAVLQRCIFVEEEILWRANLISRRKNDINGHGDGGNAAKEQFQPADCRSGRGPESPADKPEPPQGIKDPEQCKQAALNHIRAVNEILDRKVKSEEAHEFKKWLLTIGHRVAEAYNEGGIFGFAGERVSEAEKNVLRQIAFAQRRPAS